MWEHKVNIFFLKKKFMLQSFAIRTVLLTWINLYMDFFENTYLDKSVWQVGMESKMLQNAPRKEGVSPL